MTKSYQQVERVVFSSTPPPAETICLSGDISTGENTADQPHGGAREGKSRDL